MAAQLGAAIVSVLGCVTLAAAVPVAHQARGEAGAETGESGGEHSEGDVEGAGVELRRRACRALGNLCHDGAGAAELWRTAGGVDAVLAAAASGGATAAQALRCLDKCCAAGAAAGLLLGDAAAIAALVRRDAAEPGVQEHGNRVLRRLRQPA